MSVCHVDGLKLRFDSTTMMGLYEYILQLLPCIFMIFLLLFKVSLLTASRERNHST